MKKLHFPGLLALMALLLLSTCSNPADSDAGGPWEMGTFTINLGDNKRAAYPPDIPVGNNPGGYTANDLEFSVKFLQGGAVKGTFYAATGTTTLSGKIATGDYAVEVEVFLVSDSSLLALGGATGGTVTIVKGNNDIHVTLNRAIIITPLSVSVAQAGTQVFSATVYGVTTPAITWDVTGGNGTSSISSGGMLTVGVTETVSTDLTVTAEYTDGTNRRIVTSTVTVLAFGTTSLTGTLDIAGCCASNPGINHDCWVNATLTATYTPGNGGGTSAIQWQRNGTDIPGATGSTYVVTDTDRTLGATITATIQYSGNVGLVTSGSHGPIQDLTGIYTDVQLAAISSLAANLTKNYIQTRDITLSGNWTRIGYGSGTSAFSASYDGNDKTITGLTISTPTANYQGLFGYITGTVKNINLASVNITGTGRNYIGAIAGYCNGGLIDNCSVQGSSSISGDDYVGGIAGYTGSTDTISNCEFTGSVTGLNYVGGIGGSGGIVSACSTLTGSVNGVTCVGGIVGECSNLIDSCYSEATVTATESQVGGIAGYVYGGRTIVDCYSSGNVICTGASATYYSAVGGIVGYGAGTSGTYVNIERCYATGTVTGYGGWVGGIVGGLKGTVKDCYATGNVSSTNFGSAGGVFGHSAAGFFDNNPVIQNCYATGNVSGTEFSGGIQGGSENISIVIPGTEIRNCVALNKNVTATASTGYIGRVRGYDLNDILVANYGRNGMTVTTAGSNTPVVALDGKDGADITSTDWYNPGWWSANMTTWNFTNVWYPPSGTTLPTLRGVGGTQNPTVTP